MERSGRHYIIECAGTTEVEGSSWRGEIFPLRGLGLVSETLEPYRLNETPYKCPMVTIRMVPQCEWRADGWHKPAANNLTVKTCACSLDEHAGSDLEPCLQSRQRSVRIVWQHLTCYSWVVRVESQ